MTDLLKEAPNYTNEEFAQILIASDNEKRNAIIKDPKNKNLFDALSLIRIK